MATKEALACGLPVVSVRVGDLELFGEVPDGLVCADDRPLALASALRDVLQRAAKERVSLLPQSLTLEVAARRLAALYRQLSPRLTRP